MGTKRKNILSPWFEEGLSELMFWTEKGAKCFGGQYEGTSRDTLKNCSTAVNNNCDRNFFSNISDSLGSVDCYNYADNIVDQYKTCLRREYADETKICNCFQFVNHMIKPNCDVDSGLNQVLEAHYECVDTVFQCNLALKKAAGEIGYCARDSDDEKTAPWTRNHDALNDDGEADDAVDARWAGLCSLNF